MLDPPQNQEVRWSGTSFKKMNNLRILVVRNTQFSTNPRYLPNSLKLLDWDGYPSASLPPDFSPEKLICLKLCNSIFRLKGPFKSLEYLTCMDLSHCELITEVPDLSRYQSLRKLLFKDCYNLIKVHDSVGFLSKLVELDVGGCVKLTSFPNEINMPCLQDISFNGCMSLDYFPHVVGKMDALTDVWAENTSIKELPPSIANLSGLESLNLGYCRNLRELPNSLFTLPNLSWLDLGGIQPNSRQSLRKLIHENQPVINRSNMEFLILKNCCLLDEDIHLTLNLFRNLIELDLSGNDFVSIHECIKDCGMLWELHVDNCKKLRQIPELPTNLQKIGAQNCISLTTESLDNLWSQAKSDFSEGMKTIFPATTTFPEWFHNWSEGGKLCFLAQKNFPPATFAFELGEAYTKRKQYFQFSLKINGHVFLKTRAYHIYFAPRHVALFNLSRIFSSEDWRWLQKFLVLDWNDVEIQVTCEAPEIHVVKCGVYVYKQITNMEDIRFKSPTMLSMDDTRTSLKRRAIASPPYEPPNKKVLPLS